MEKIDNLTAELKVTCWLMGLVNSKEEYEYLEADKENIITEILGLDPHMDLAPFTVMADAEGDGTGCSG